MRAFVRLFNKVLPKLVSEWPGYKVRLKILAMAWWRPSLTTNNLHLSIAFHKAGEISTGLGNDFNLGKSLQHFIP
jgi:hypothetical protein